MEFPMYNTERQNQLSAAQQPLDMFKFLSGQQQSVANDVAPNLLNAYLKQQYALAEVGQNVQAHDQAQISADQQYQQESIYNYLDANNSYLNSAYSMGGAGRTQTSQADSGSTLLQSLLGGGASAASILSSL